MREPVYLLEDNAEAIRKLPARPTDEDLKPLLIETHGKLSIYFAPFEWINTRAKIVICGITPCKKSMLKALQTAKHGLNNGQTFEQVSQASKQTGIFSNMRPKLTKWLDAIGVNTALKLDTAGDLFDTRMDLLHNTASIRFPVFSNGKNYSGYSPRIVVSSILKMYVTTYLAEEVKALPKAIFVPNGSAVAEACLLAGVSEDRLLVGFPHASNAIGAVERQKTFDRERDQLAQKVVTWAKHYQ